MGGCVKRCLLLLLAVVTLSACVTTGNEFGNQANPIEASRLNTQLGIDYMRRGRTEQARDKLQRAVEQDGDNAVAHSSLAFVYTYLGDPERAERHYLRALSLDSGNPDTQNNFGTFLCGQNRRAEAEQHFVKAAKDPRFGSPAAAWTNAGICLRRVDFERAEGYLREALRIDPKFPDALAQMAWISYQRGDFLKSRAFLQRYEAVGQQLPETLWIGAQTERKLGDVGAARRYMDQLREQFPDSEEAFELDKSGA